MAGFKRMAAKFAGKCAGCGSKIAVGDDILWAKGRGARHAECGLNEDFGGAEFRLSQQDEFDWEAAEIRREEAEYQRGYHEVRQIQAFAPAGSALREQMYAEMEMAAYNRGEDY